jgi:hypothetical protein
MGKGLAQIGNGDEPRVSPFAIVHGIHPAVLDGYIDGALAQALKQRADQELRRNIRFMKPEEAAILAFLRHRLGEAEDGIRVGASAPASPKRGGRRFRGSRRAR